MIQTLQVLALSAALLLLASGLAKLAEPRPAARMIAGVLPHMPRALLSVAVRAAAVAELVVGAAAIALGGRWALAAVAALYAAFGVVVLLSLRRGARASCGCFGGGDAPLGRPHLVVDVLAAAIAAGAAASGPKPLAGIADLAPLTAAVAVGQVLLLAWLGYLALTALPSLAAARRLVLEESG